MKPVKSSSFPADSILPAIELRPDDLSQHAQTAFFSTAINALSMARRHLLEGDERAAEEKAAAALEALRRLVLGSGQVQLTH